MEILRTQDITKYYSGRAAIEDVSLSIETGKIYGLLGPNGSGKSTFMRTVAGYCHPNKGTVEIAGQPKSYETKAMVAYMPTESYFNKYMTIKQAKDYYTDFFLDFDGNKFDEILSTMQLDASMKIKTLSSGMNAKLRVALTMSRNAKLFMLDEPLNGIDLVARDVIVSTVISQLKDDNAIIISSHMIGAIEKVLDKVILIKDGRIVINENAESVREDQGKSIMDLYREVFAL